MQASIDFLFPLKDHVYSAVYDQVFTKLNESQDDITWCQTSDESIHDEAIVSIAKSLFSGMCPEQELLF